MASASATDQALASSAVQSASEGSVEDKFELVKQLGAGAFAVVWLANKRADNHAEVPEVVAIKRINRRSVVDPKHVLREVAILKETSKLHPGINTLYELYEGPETLDLVL